MSDKFEISKASGPHFQLKNMVGEWEGTATTWFEPDTIADQSPITGSMRLILGGRFLLHEYNTKFGGQPIEGLAIFGYHLALEQFQSAWMDSFHNGTAIMFSEGKRSGGDFSILGSYAYVTPEMEQHWGWRTTIESDADTVTIIAYNVTPEGEESKATEILYRRVR